jgi:hypothetical protein
MIKRTLPVLGLCLSVALAGEKAPGFARKPTAVKVNGKVKIEFAASGQTDCAVYVLNAGGRVVRHLVAGILGKSSPKPLEPGLAQSIEWDGKDDLGKPATGGPFSVRVALGLDLKPDRVVGQRTGLSGVRGLAVGPTGDLYVLGSIGNLHSGCGSPVCLVFDRQGKYLRTIMPHSGDLPPGKTAGFGCVKPDDQGQIPFVHCAENRSLYARLREPARCWPAVTGEGRLVFAQGTRSAAPVLMRVEADGSCPADGFLGAELHESPGRSFVSLAVAPDGKMLYCTGLTVGSGRKARRLAAVWKLAPGAKIPEVFVGDPEQPGGGKTGLNDPRCVSVDAKGNVYVADNGNGRIAAFKPDGAYLGEVKADSPDSVAVHHKTGAIYALTGKDNTVLVKFKGLGRAGAVATYKLKPYGGIQHPHYRPLMTVDPEAEPAIVWAGGINPYSSYRVLRLEDGGESFSGAAETCGEGLIFFDMSLDKARDALCLRTGGPNLGSAEWIDGATGKRTRIAIKYEKGASNGGALLVCGRDGSMYLKTAGTPEKRGVYRFTRDMKPAPFDNGKGFVSVPQEATSYDSCHLLARGMDVDDRGTGAVHIEYRGPKNKDRGRHWGKILLFDAGGKVVNHSLVDGLTAGACSPRIDNAGNIYVADCSKPAGQVVPPGLKGKVSEGKRLPDGSRNWYPAVCASIIKFPPIGGKLRDGGARTTVGYGGSHDLNLAGALWQRGGVSGAPLHGGVGGAYYCSCEQMRFDVDGFGRVFAPDVVRFQVVVMDTDGKAIGRFGTYGNADVQAKGAALRFAWPLYVAAGDRAVYVGDILNRSVVRVLIAYAAEETVPVR